MKKFIVYLLVIVFTVSLSFAVFYLVRNDEVITISASSMYVDKDDTFTIDITDQNKKEYSDVVISSSNENIVKYDATKKNFIALSGGVSRINFRTNNVNFRNLSCDVIVGDGTITSPYYISTAEQLAAIGMGEQLKDEDDNLLNAYAGKAPFTKYASDKYYKLIDNIDVSTVNGGYWVPLRNFSGSFDGNGLTISKVSIDIENYKALNDGKSGLFGSENVGFFSEILPGGIVYNLKFENFGASGSYTNFGCVAGVNNGTIERVEVKDAFLSVETKVFGGITAINNVKEIGENDTYTREIARIECSNVDLTLGRKFNANSSEIVTYGVTGTIGGIVGINNGGTIAYSYSTGDVYFGQDIDDGSRVVYGGIVGENNAVAMTKIGGVYTQYAQGGNIKDSYSSIYTYLMKAPHTASLFGGVIGINTDISLGKYDDNDDMLRVASYFAGVKYNKESLNLSNIDGYTKSFSGVAKNIVSDVNTPFVEKDITITGLTISEMQSKDNFISYKTQVDEDGNVLEELRNELWTFGTIWAIDDKVNDGMPYLNYTVVTIADDFRYVGIPVIDNGNYSFTFDVNQPIVIVSGQNSYLELKLNESYNLVVSPYEAMKDVVWTSSDNKIVSVDNNGKITALDGGIVTITAEHQKSGSVDTINVRVIVEDVYYVENLAPEINLYVDDDYQIGNYTIYVNGFVVTNKDLTFYSKDNTIVSVSAEGKVVAKAVGSTYIDVSIGNFSKSILVNVYAKEDNVNKIVDIKFKETNFLYTYSGSQIDGNIIITSAICNSVDIKDTLTFTFETENDMVEIYYNLKTTVSDGLAIPFKVKGAGRCVVTCVVNNDGYYSNATDIVIVSELEEQQESLLLNEYSIKLLEGTTKQLIATGFTNKTVTWKSLNTEVARVDKYGLVTAVSEGSTSISASITLNDGTKLVNSCFVTVVGEDKYINHSVTLNGKSLGSNLVIYGMTVNEEITIKLETNYKFASNENFEWEISREGYRNVSYSGSNKNTVKIQPLYAGKIQVTASVGSNTSVTFYLKVLKASANPEVDTTPTYNKYITNINELNNVRYHLDKDFILSKSIDLSGIAWEPFAWKDGEYFTGSFTACNGSVISNMTISGDYNGYHALFGKIKDATIQAVAINNANVTTYNYGAGIVAYAIGNSSIVDCKVENSTFHSTQSNSNMGAIIATASYSTNITIRNCASTNNSFSVASGCYSSIGGIAGSSASLVEYCRVSKISISGNYNTNNTYAGGVVGYNTGVINNSYITLTSTIVGYYAGGLSGNLNNPNKIKVKFSTYDKGYRKQDASEISYTASISKSYVDPSVTIKGVMVGGLVGVISSGAVVDCYTRAKLEGLANNAVLGGFTAELMSDSNFKRSGGYGNVGIIDTCYSACTFSGSGKFHTATSSVNVHKYNFFGGENTLRNAGYIFNYVVEERSKVTNLSCSGLKDHIKAVKSNSEMKNKDTYIERGFSSTVWDFSAGYPTLKLSLFVL